MAFFFFLAFMQQISDDLDINTLLQDCNCGFLHLRAVARSIRAAATEDKVQIQSVTLSPFPHLRRILSTSLPLRSIHASRVNYKTCVLRMLLRF
jgi:hypothetical protein